MTWLEFTLYAGCLVIGVCCVFLVVESYKIYKETKKESEDE
jgi:hypothetical protein